jgi:flagellar M-ring protein FliF
MAEETELALPNAGFAGSMGQLGNKFMLLVAIAIVIAFMAAFWLWSQQPDYRVLFSNFSDKDGGAIVASLEKMNIPYKFTDGGSAILVPAASVHQARLKLATEGLPKGGNVGFELLENQKFGVSQFIEQVNFQRALEGELERSIQTISAVSEARIHLAIPKSSVFVRDKQDPTASVVLNLRGGRTLDAQQVGAIVHLVASSVPNLPAKNVTVVDQNGNLLSDMSKKVGPNNLDPSQLKYIEEIQQSISRRIEAIITPIVGANNVKAQASAEIDFSRVEQAAESYKPNQNPTDAAIRSQQTNEAETLNGGEAGGVPGALTNQPPADATAPIEGGADPNAAGANATPINKQKNSTTNFEVDKTVRYVQQNVGGIKRLNVAVVVNNMPVVGADGKVTYRALTDAEKTQINDLAMQAMGFNKERGDELTVVNSPFAVETVAPIPEVPLWQNPEAIEYAKDTLRFLVGVIVLMMMYKKVVKPLVTKLTVLPEPPRLNGPNEDEKEVEEDGSVVSLSGEQTGVDADGNPVASQKARALSRESTDDLAFARQIAKDNPRLVANVVSGWSNG